MKSSVKIIEFIVMPHERMIIMGNSEQRHFKFSRPLLMDVQFSFNRDYPWEDNEKNDEKPFETPLQIEVSKPRIESNSICEASVGLTVLVGERGPNFPYYISVAISADFTWSKELSLGTVNEMLSRNAPALLLGYVRPYVAQITEASPVGAVHIPFMNFAPQEKPET